MRRFLLAPLFTAVFSALLIGAPTVAYAATPTANPSVLAIVPASAHATCSYRLDTTHNGVTTYGHLQTCPANTLQHTITVTESVAKAHHWSYFPIPTRSATPHPESAIPSVTRATTSVPHTTCPFLTAAQQMSPNCGGGGGGGSPCNYFQNLWTWATFGDGVGFFANVAYTVDCGHLQLNWSQIGQFGYYGANYTLAFTDYNAVNIGTFWQGIPHGSYSFQGYGRWTSLGGDFVFATYNNADWGDWDWLNMGNLW